MRPVLILLVTGTLVVSGCGDAAYIERLAITNPTPYDLFVDVKGKEDKSWLELGTAPRESRHVVEQVTDMGEMWAIRIRYEDRILGQEELSRTELIRDRWQYRIPEMIGQILAEQGEPPSWRS